MPNFVDVWERRTGVGGAVINDMPIGFPMTRWQRQIARYQRYWELMTGEIYTEEERNRRDAEHNEPVLRWPLQINHFLSIVQKHNDAMFGEVADVPGPMVPIRAYPRSQGSNDDDIPEAEKKIAKKIERFVNDVWNENSGRALQQEAGLICNGIGGVVLKAAYAPDDEDLEFKLRITMVLPDFFMPIADSENPDNLLEAWIAWRIPAKEAELKYGVTARGEMTYYVEHWTKDKISITIGQEPIKHTFKDGTTVVYDGVKNPFGIIPMVYIPIERIGSYYGVSRLEGLEGLSKEINSRFADLGDIVRNNTDQRLWGRNITQARTRDIGAFAAVTDVGTASGPERQPELNVINPPQITPKLIELPEELRQQLSRTSNVPPVADGEDEGSQRSALTLAFRMWPLTSRAKAARTNWTNGLIRFAKILIRMASVIHVGDVTEEMLGFIRLGCDWSPQIPRDREQVLNEVILLVQVGALSPVTALGMLDIVDDPQAELLKVREDLQFKSDLATAAEAKKQEQKLQKPVADSGYNNQ